MADAQAQGQAAAVIVAAGRGTRAGSAVPKQWREIMGQTIVAHTVAAFADHPRISQVVLVIHPDDAERARAAVDEQVRIVTGGTDRAQSVQSGLAAAHAPLVLIHDVARPLVRSETISAVLRALADVTGAAPAVPVTDALWTGSEGRVTGTHDRAGLYRAQTPQGFRADAIRAAHAAHPGGAADDVEVARAFGLDVAIVPGDEENLKITHPDDFDRAERILRARHGH